MLYLSALETLHVEVLYKIDYFYFLPLSLVYCICSSGMNRHHFAVFVHNSRLVLLLRQEPGHGVDLNTFKPAEWRWKLAQVCDGEWHHYAISVDFPQVLRNVWHCAGLMYTVPPSGLCGCKNSLAPFPGQMS